MEKGLGKGGPDNEKSQGFNQDFGGFGDDVDTGIGEQPTQKKKAGPKNILDEWTEAAGGGW